MKQNNIIFVVSGSEGYGMRRVWQMLFSGLTKSGYHIVVAVLDRKFRDNWHNELAGTEVFVPSFNWKALPKKDAWAGKYWAIWKQGISQLKLSAWLLSLQRVHRADAIVFQGPIEALLCGIVARRSGVPALWFVPNAINDNFILNFNKRIYRSLFRLGNVVPISNSRFTDSTFGKGTFRRHVVHLGVDTDAFCPGPPPEVDLRRELGIPEAAMVVGLFARMVPMKGQLELIRAAARLKEETWIILCGGPLDGSYYYKVVQEVAKLGMTHRIHFAGLQQDLSRYYAACDIIANLRVDPEPFGLTVIEAMASGKPVLAHASGGPSETILDPETGWLIESCEVADIVTGLRRALSDRGRWAEKGRAGRERVEHEFSLSTFTARAEEVISGEIQRSKKRCSSSS